MKRLYILLFIDLAFLLFGITQLDISYKEAVVFFDKHNFLHYLIKFSTLLFGQNDFALRFPFILFHLLSVILLYKISGFYIKKEEDRVYAVALFILLPGVVSSSLIVNYAPITIFFTLLFVYLYENNKKIFYYPLLFVLVFIDGSFEVLYLGIFAYAVYKNNKKLYITSAILFLLTLYIYGFDSGGRPRGYFLDTLAMYALVFSPLLFLYYFYAMYRILFKKEKSLLWFISFTALVLSILLSFRQRVSITDFAPYGVIAIPLVYENFLRSYKVRLPEFRKFYTIGLYLTIFLLIVNFLFTYFNKNLYLFLSNPNKHFARKFHIAKKLSKKLKTLNINNILCNDKTMCKRLHFYNISQGKKYILSKTKLSKDSKKVTISYINTPIATYYVSKLHTLKHEKK